jgi:rhomboid protease GluP
MELRQTDDAAKAGDWALVLAAAGVAHELRQIDGGAFVLLVDDAEGGAAGRALDAYDAESRANPEPPAHVEGKSALGIAVAILLLGFHLVAGARDVTAPSAWFAAGSASAERIMQGQWWRAVTALTLHGDLMHLFGNALASLIFIAAVGRWLGSGVGAALILLAGAAGNLLTAAVDRTRYVSVGASTATFAALGIMAGLQVVRRSRHRRLTRRAWLLPIGAGLGLFAMLGVGPNADVLAHLFGLGAGCVVGIAAGIAVRRRAAPFIQAALAVATAAAVAGAWLLAFARA